MVVCARWDDAHFAAAVPPPRPRAHDMRLMSFQCVLCGFPLVLILFLSLHQSSAQILDTPADTAAPGELGYSSDDAAVIPPFSAHHDDEDAPVEDASTAAEVAAPAAPPPRGFASVSSIPWLQKPCHLNCKKWTIVGSGKITMEEYRTIDSADGCVAWFSKLRKYMAGNKISLLVSRHAEEREGWSRIPTNTPLCPILHHNSSIVRKNHRFWTGGYLDPIWIYEKYLALSTREYPDHVATPNTRLFPGCPFCNTAAGNPCAHGSGRNGPSTGAAFVSYLQSASAVERIDTYGMTFGLQEKYGYDFHIDFLAPIVRQCCTKCVFHGAQLKREELFKNVKTNVHAAHSAAVARRDSLRGKLAALRQRPKPWIQHGRR